MCGIAGIWDPERRLANDCEDLRRIARAMADRLEHRGPDDSGEWCDPSAGVAFGFRRLSILDLSPTGHQPMQSSSGRYSTVFNGEIYNCRSLRRTLEQQSVSFRGTSDTEILLEAVASWGLDETLSKAVGMFGLALWDNKETRLHLARDRMGEKPVYVLKGQGWVAFASELKAFSAIPAWRPEIDRESVAEFVSYGYIRAPRSIYQDVSKLLPGTVMTLETEDITSRQVLQDRTRKYWSLPTRDNVGREEADDASALDRFEEILSSTVKDQSLADVPVGAFLSGGIDSSTVVALLQSVSSSPVRTFTVRFPIASHDESPWAEKVARMLGTDHTVLDVDADELISAVPEMGRVFDEPFADPSQVPMYLISREAKRHVKVCLTGDGGDEVFGGYNRYIQFRKTERAIAAVPASARPALRSALGRIPVRWLDAVVRGLRRGQKDAAPLQSAGSRVHKLATMLAMPDIMSRYDSLLRTSIPDGMVLGVEKVPNTTNFGEFADDDIEDLLMRQDLVGYLPDDNLVKVDRASMAHGLECRAPILDHRVVEAALALPMRQRIRNGKGKWVLRGLFARHLPQELLDRPKAGFSVPVSDWFRNDLRDWIRSLLVPSDMRDQGYFSSELVGKILSEHIDGGRDHGRLLWALAIFQSWLQAQDNT